MSADTELAETMALVERISDVLDDQAFSRALNALLAYLSGFIDLQVGDERKQEFIDQLPHEVRKRIAHVESKKKL